MVLLRVEDLDRPRVVAGSEAEQRSDLAWLGLDLVEPASLGLGPTRQSERIDRYEAAIAMLDAAGHTYLCDCSRAEIARAASAPHEGEEGPAYPGTCRPLGMAPRAFKRPPALRLAAPSADVDDFVLRRGDGVFAYQLAVVVDDLAMGVSEIVRGIDLRPSVPRQTALARLLGGELPPVVHVPLLVGPSGARLAKRDGGSTVRELAARGVTPSRILQSVARAYGFDVPGRDVVAELAACFDPQNFSVSPVPLGAVEAAA